MAAELAARIELADARGVPAARNGTDLSKVWSAIWPKLAAAGLAVGAWQLVVWSGWEPDYILPGPLPVLERLAQDLRSTDFDIGVAITLRRAVVGYAIAVTIGSTAGILLVRISVLRKAVGAAIFGLQSMPSIAWFPLAVLLFGNNETAIFFVVILGAAPAIAGGLLNGVDHVQPVLIRVGLTMGARGLGLYRHVVLPAALPAFVGGLKQGWAFAWRSLMAGEIINIVGHQLSIGEQIQFAHDFADAEQLVAILIVVFIVGVVVDGLFSIFDGEIRKRWGLGGEQ